MMAKTNNRLCFPQRLFLLLKLVEDKGLDHIVSWVDDGSAFKVHNLKKFQDELLPKYFSTKRYASFTRQLCAYGFSCLRTGRQTGIYSHPCFHRNDPASSFQIKREPAKSNTKTSTLVSDQPPKATLKANDDPASSLGAQQPGIPRAIPLGTFEFPALFGSGRHSSADHSNQLVQLHKLLCTPAGDQKTQPVMTQTGPGLHAPPISSVVSLPSIMEEANTDPITANSSSMDNLEPIPVFSSHNHPLAAGQKRESPLAAGQKRESLECQADAWMRRRPSMEETKLFNFVPLSPEIYGETRPDDFEPTPLSGLRSIHAMVTPI